MLSTFLLALGASTPTLLTAAASAAATPFAPREFWLPPELQLVGLGFPGLEARQLETAASGQVSFSFPPARTGSMTPLPSSASSRNTGSMTPVSSASFPNTTGSMTPTPTSSLAPGAVVHNGETYTYGSAELPVETREAMRCPACTLNLSGLCPTGDRQKCTITAEDIQIGAFEECYKCSRRVSELSESARLNITTNRRFCIKEYGIDRDDLWPPTPGVSGGSGALSTLAVSGGAVAMALAALSFF